MVITSKEESIAKVKELLAAGKPFAYVAMCEAPENPNDKFAILHKAALEESIDNYIVGSELIRPGDIDFPEGTQVFNFDKIESFSDIEDAVESIHDSKAKVVAIQAGNYAPIIQHFVFMDNANITTLNIE